MQKNISIAESDTFQFWKKVPKAKMYLQTLAIALALLTTVITTTAREQSTKITLKLKSVTLKTVFREIEEKTDYFFWYNSDVNDQAIVDIDVATADIKETLSKLLVGQALTYQISGKSISISRLQQKAYTPEAKYQKDRTITGTVTDDQGRPLPGATVSVKGKMISASTDKDGRFTLTNVPENATLTISFVGYLDKEISSTGIAGPINISLQSKTSDLDDVQIVAYGSTIKRYQVGNVSSISSKDIEKQPVTNPLLTLQGNTPGVFITQSTGLPGSGVNILIQGQNSLQQGNSPLYLIDGVPYSSELPPNLGGVLGLSGQPGNNQTSGNPLSFINPSDIESISILKDADATAIYGSRGANGVVLITTKKGKSGKASLDVNFQSGYGQVGRKLKLLNTQEYLAMRKEGMKNASVTTPASTDYDINGVWDTTRNTDWQKELIGRTARYTNVAVNVSGGSENTHYLIGATYNRQTTVYPSEFADKKGSFHFNLNSNSVDQKFKINLTGSYQADKNQLPNADLTVNAIVLAPDAPALYKDDGTLNWQTLPNGNSTWTNPLAPLNTTYTGKTNNLVSNMTVSYEIIKNLDLKASMGYTSLQSNDMMKKPITAVRPESRPTSTRSANFGNSLVNSWILEPQAEYSNNILKGKLTALVGFTIQRKTINSTQYFSSGFNSDFVMDDIRSASAIGILGTVASDYRYNALFGRINYNLKNKYLLNLTMRRDGSSRFGPANRFHNFGAVGAGWIFTEEEFVKKTLPVLSFGKIRASYGTTGNDQIGDYSYLNLYSSFTAGTAYQGVTGLTPNNLTNPYLQWEETKKMQAGLDLGFFKDRLLFSATYYQNRSSNLLVGYNLSLITGFSNITKNFPATVQNSGLEFSITSNNITAKNFKWTTNFNLTFNRNKLVSFENLALSSYASNLIIGQPINVTKVYKLLGVNKSTGVYEFEDSHGNAIATPNALTDNTVIKNLNPKYYGGMTNTFQYKGISLDFMFQFVKQEGFNYKYGYSSPGQFLASFGNQPMEILDRWQKTDDIASHQKFISNSSLTASAANARLSDQGISDASYVRLKNIAISWELNDRWKRSIGLKQCRIFAQGQNMFTITNYIGLDPETRSSTSLPPLRVFTFGFQMAL